MSFHGLAREKLKCISPGTWRTQWVAGEETEPKLIFSTDTGIFFQGHPNPNTHNYNWHCGKDFIRGITKELQGRDVKDEAKRGCAREAMCR